MGEVRTIDAATLDRDHAYHLLNSLVVPRPIAWVSTISAAGARNLAPHSYFTVAAVTPPVVAFVSVGRKDTITNIESTREFVVNVVDRAHAQEMNITAATAPAEIDEFELAGLTAVPSSMVAPPRVAQSPVSLECRLHDIVEVGSDPGYIVLGEVVCFHIPEDMLDANCRVDPERLDAIARMGGNVYATTTDRFDMKRPKYADLVEHNGQ